jgi:TPR repeat protein
MPDAWRVLQKAAPLNDPAGQFRVGKTISLGCAVINLPANPRAGLVWIRRSADQGYAEAKSFLLSV